MSPGLRKDLLWLRQVSSFAASRVILTANTFRFFDRLEGPGLTSSALARRAGTDPRATELLLNSLAGIGLLSKKASVYRNTPVASRYLVSGKPEYQGDILRHYAALWKNWSGLDAVLKTGKPNRVARDHRSFILGMDNLARLRVKQVIAAIDLQGVRTVLDLGGGPGTYSIEFARRKKDVTLFDFAETLTIAGQVIGPTGMQGRISLRPGDFMTDDFGAGYDLVLVSQILHAYPERDCIGLLRRCRKALNPGGRVVIQEFPLDETRTNPPMGSLFAINMLVNTLGGRTYTPGEMKGWLKKTGFRDIRARNLPDSVLVVASLPHR